MEPNTNKRNMKKVKNGISYEMNGWIYVSIKGKPRERGYAYGRLVADEMKRVKKIQEFITYNDYGVKWQFFIDAAGKYFKPKIMEHIPEFYWFF